VQPNSPEPSPGRADAVTPVFLRMPTVMRMTGLGRSTIYRLIADRQFPRSVGGRKVCFANSIQRYWLSWAESSCGESFSPAFVSSRRLQSF
jgi:prophage regulatory protein